MILESSPQPPELNGMKLYVYRRALHPELFGIFLDHELTASRYQADLWVIGLGHLVCFHTGQSTVTELVSSHGDLMPEAGLVEQFGLNKARERRFCIDEQIHYLTSTQSERMSEPVFDHFCEEMIAFGQQRGLLVQFEQWAGDEQPVPFSLIDYEHRSADLHVFAYHAFPSQKLVLKTQSVFSLEPIGREAQHDGCGGLA